MLLWKVRTREDVGTFAARRLADRIMRAHSIHKTNTRIVLAAAPSQEETLKRLLEYGDIPWRDITVGHMDEYVWGGRKPGPQSFPDWLERHFIKELQQHRGLGNWIRIDGTVDPLQECQRLNALFGGGIHVLANGIGWNGHCGFEDPGADLLTPDIFRVRQMDEVCRMQQVDPQNPDLFATIDEVPRTAITLTIPAAARAGSIVGSVFGEAKARAVRDAFEKSLSNEYPLMCVMRAHDDAVLVADAAATSHMTFDRQKRFYGE